MSDLLKEWFDYYKSRIESPIFFTFIMAWMAFNKGFIFIVLFQDSSIKYQSIISYDFTWCFSLVYPFLLTIFYITCVPFANNILQLVKYFFLNRIQSRVQKSKSSYLTALELKQLELERVSLKNEIKKFEDEKDLILSEAASLREQIAVCNREKVSLFDAMTLFEKRFDYYRYIVRLFNVQQATQPFNRQSSFTQSQTVESTSLITFKDLQTGALMQPMWLHEIPVQLSLSFADMLSIKVIGSIGKEFDFNSSEGKSVRLRITDIRYLHDSGSSEGRLPYDLIDPM